MKKFSPSSIRKSMVGLGLTYEAISAADIACMPVVVRSTIEVQLPVARADLAAFFSEKIPVLQPDGYSPFPGITYRSDQIFQANVVPYTMLVRAFQPSRATVCLVSHE